MVRKARSRATTTSAAWKCMWTTPFSSRVDPAPRLPRRAPPADRVADARSTAQARTERGRAGAGRGGASPGRVRHPQGRPAAHARAGRRAPCRTRSGQVFSPTLVAGAPSPPRRPSSCQPRSPPRGKSGAGSRGRGPRERTAPAAVARALRVGAGASCQRAPGPSRCPMRRPCSQAPTSAPCTPEACQPHPRAVRAGPPPSSQTSCSPRERPRPGAAARTQTFPEKEVINSSVQKTSLNCDLFTLPSWSRSDRLGHTRRPSASCADDQPPWRHPFPILA